MNSFKNLPILIKDIKFSSVYNISQSYFDIINEFLNFDNLYDSEIEQLIRRQKITNLVNILKENV